MIAVVSWWQWLGVIAGVGLLIRQWRRAAADRWRQVAWLLAVLSWCVLLTPSWLPRWPQRVPPLAIVTPGGDDSAAQAEAWAQRQGASIVHLPALPTRAQLDSLQPYRDADWQLFGHGFLPAAWTQLAPRTIYWQAPESPVWRLRYEHDIQRGDSVNFALTAPAAAVQAALRDSRNEPVLVIPVVEGHAEWSWRPATAGRYDWTVQVTDATGAVLKTVPVAIAVQMSSAPFVRGQFAAPSFEQRALRQWLEQAGFSGEFVSATGPSLQRRDRFGDSLSGDQRAALYLIALRAWQQASEKQRRSWLANAAAGSTLVLLADDSENELALRTELTRELAMTWHERTEAEQALQMPELVLQQSRWYPETDNNWQARTATANVQVRRWQQGQLVWVGVLDSHRWWARQPIAYAEWWQQALQGQRSAAPGWVPQAAGVVGRFAALCIDNLDIGNANLDDGETAKLATTTLMLQAPDGSHQALALQADSWPGRACAYLAPDQSGWYEMLAPVTGSWRVWPTPALAEDDAWAARDASERHSVAPTSLQDRKLWQLLPRWPFFLLWLSALTLIWWRERRQRGA